MDGLTRRSLITTTALLVTLAVLSGVLMAGQPAPSPLCDAGSVLPILPLRVDYPAYRLESWGRSAAEVPPGGGLCVGFAWRTEDGLPPADRVTLEVTSGDGQVVARYNGPLAADPQLWQPAAEPVTIYPLRVVRSAPSGRYLITLRLLAPGGSPLATRDGREALTIGTLHVSESARERGSVGRSSGSPYIHGGLEQWPFWPHIERHEEEF